MVVLRFKKNIQNILEGEMIIMPEISNKLSGFTESVIRKMTRIANKYGAINLSQGFPDFDPPKEITEELKK